MPIFEYRCKACGHQFEALVLSRARPSSPCPRCGGEQVEKLLSAFGVGGTTPRGAAAVRPGGG